MSQAMGLSVFSLRSAASEEVVKGCRLRMVLMCLVKVVWQGKQLPTVTPTTQTGFIYKHRA